MAKFQSPLLGYNNNVRHRGRVFHIQTEDSGVNHPHIITHLFMDGGRILKSVKRSYAEHVGSDNMSETVRVLMKEQHKAMFIALRDGQFDELAFGPKKPSGAIAAAETTRERAANLAPPAPVAAPAPPPRATGALLVPPPPAPVVPPPAPSGSDVAINAVAAATVVKVSSDRHTRTPQPAPRSETVRPSPVTRPDPPRSFTPEDTAPVTIDDGGRTFVAQPRATAEPPLPPELEALLRDELPPPPALPRPHAPARARTGIDEPPNTTREPERRRSAQELTLDFDALERDAGPSPIFQHSDLPPPPKNLFAKEPRTGTYSAVEADAHQEASRAPAQRALAPARTPEQPPARQGGSPSRTPTPKPPSEGRYAPARPAAIFGATSKPPPSPSIFGDDLVSDKSLDEVILSYLAEDLDPPRRK